MKYRYQAKYGNLVLEEDATFIVNASNTRLMLSTGISSAFKDHCGYVLQDELLQVVQRVAKPIKRGSVFKTSAGEATNFTFALHATVMDYNPGNTYRSTLPELNDIQSILENIEYHLQQYCDETRLSIKLVLPLLGCGSGRLDKGDVLNLYRTFLERSIDFDCEVIVYGYTQEDYELIQSILTH